MDRFLSRWRAATTAFLLWGGWAIAANWQAGPADAIVPGLLQGAASFLITLLMGLAVEWQVRQFNHSVTRICLPPLLTVTVTGSFLFIVHSLGQTPQIWRTIIPPMTVALLYCFFLTFTQTRAARRITT